MFVLWNRYMLLFIYYIPVDNMDCSITNTYLGSFSNLQAIFSVVHIIKHSAF